jgi:DNA-binding IclR family transcriptional regulator
MLQQSKPSSLIISSNSQGSRASGPVVRAFSILRCISEGSNTLSDIARKCNMSRSTAHALLQKLIRSNAVIQDPTTHNYFLSQLITRMASNNNTAHRYLIHASMEEMKYLANSTQERITLTILIALKPARLNAIHGKHALRVVDEDVELDPSETFLAATGKVLVSQLSEDTLKKMSKFMIPSLKTSALAYDELMVDINKVRQQGYFVTTGKRLEGITCVSVPVFGYSLPTSLNVIGPETRIKPNLKKFIEMAKKSATRISKDIETEIEK